MLKTASYILSYSLILRKMNIDSIRTVKYQIRYIKKSGLKRVHRLLYVETNRARRVGDCNNKKGSEIPTLFY